MRGEPDRYLAATLAPVGVRSALAALAAFSAEVARIPATVSEPLLGEIRLQWWRDVLTEGRDGRLSGHPVADAMIAAGAHGRFSADLLEKMIDARAFDLSGAMPESDAELKSYLAATEGSAFLLAMCALGASRTDVEELAASAGYVYGVARGLCRLPMLLHNGGVILPALRLKDAGIDPARLTSGPGGAELDSALRRLAEAMIMDARSVLAEIRVRARGLARPHRAALLPLAMVEPYFRAQSSHRIRIEPADVSPVRRVVRIGLAHLTGRP